MMKNRPVNKFEICLLLLFTVAFFYNSYRYPLMINSSVTSGGTYSDTPFLFQVGKYLLYVLLMIYMYIHFAVLRIQKGLRTWHAMLLLYLMAAPLIYGVFLRNLPLLESGFFVAVPLVLLFCRSEKFDYRRAAKALHVLLVVYLLVNAMQMVMAVVFGRLPALSRPGSAEIRFGSVLDDPNSFGVLLSFFAGFALCYYNGVKRCIVVGLIAISLVMTQSLTAIASTSLVCFVLYRQFLIKSLQKHMAGVLLSFIAFCSVVFLFKGFLAKVFRGKYSSILGHLDAFSVFDGISPYTIAGMLPTGVIGESGYVNFIVNMGGQYVLLFLLLGVMSVRELSRLKGLCSDRSELAVINATFIFLPTVMVGLLNLPYDQTFPVNAVYYTLIGLVMSGAFRRSLKSNPCETL